VSIIFSFSAIYRQHGSDYLIFDIGLICHSLGLGLELCGLVNIIGFRWPQI